MKRNFLNWLYRNNRTLFADLVVEDFYGQIPASLTLPMMDFLANSRDVLERFFSLQAYHITRRSIADIKNQSFYDGQLMYIKGLLLAVGKSGQKRSDPIPEGKILDPMEGVNDFLNKVKSDEKK